MASSCWGLPDFLCGAPEMSGSAMRAMRRTIDTGFRDMVRGASSYIDAATAPVQSFLNTLEGLFVNTPWIVVFLVLVGITWGTSRSWKITAGAGVALIGIGWFGLWNDSMITLSMVTVCTLVAVIIGLPIGILTARSDRAQRIITPVLDVMQTMPSFVYLIPVVVIFGIGKVPGMIAVVIYAMPPMIRLTNLGIRLVDREAIEAADAFGSSERQKLWNVQLPLALPTLMTGVNQTIMMALSMVVVASMVGVGGLGRNVLQAINNQFFTIGFLNGFALVAIAITFDRASQAYGKRLQRHKEVSDE
ncbi:ABC proline/glycine betaine transporter, inner membrane subunit (plasmid) [Ketogulonicigenium vulgare Y25]|uniref:ABC transporter, permease protein n=1 Tax=Ketogulonicigenium vulgare (strain WSH-001) TaxID=759362 RepID=F9YBS9_KETVW|nr:proline/glycine betaine ABC transporter permease [Ketogulonicigenium vulgare]ADO44397.1 ABC proline/glycine betaine transporter, inner membrane subunit [Ketogulonicigenium vulgare Y25]AEM42831.1 ABC transporter, permease protein [Ketogulonicigenium vulgare WSH-001]ALJ82740.1 ABC transporter permease [Ketogulonicigenium vulgare]